MVFLSIAIVVFVLGWLYVLYRHRRARSRWGPEEFTERMRALAPEPERRRR